MRCDVKQRDAFGGPASLGIAASFFFFFLMGGGGEIHKFNLTTHGPKRFEENKKKEQKE